MPAWLRTILDNPRTEWFITGVIVLNAITLGLETSKTAMDAYGPLLLTIDAIVLAIFVVELSARIFVHRLAFFKDPWSLFDFAVVAIALIPSTGNLSVLRALRILRVMRLITYPAQLQIGAVGQIDDTAGMGHRRVAQSKDLIGT